MKEEKKEEKKESFGHFWAFRWPSGPQAGLERTSLRGLQDRLPGPPGPLPGACRTAPRGLQDPAWRPRKCTT